MTTLANIKKMYYKLCYKQINVYFIFISIQKFHSSIKANINSFDAKFQTTFVKCRLLFFFNKLSLEKKFIRKVERLNVKQRKSR